MGAIYVLTFNGDTSSFRVTARADGATQMTVQAAARQKLILHSGDRINITVHDADSGDNVVRSPDGGYSTVILPQDGTYGVQAGNDTVSTIYDTAHDGPYLMQISGLVSDGQMVDVSGGFSLLVKTDRAELNYPVNLKPVAGDTISIAQVQVDMDVVRNLSGAIPIHVGFSAAITVSRVFAGSDNQINVLTDSADLSASVLALLSDWTEFKLSEISDMTLDQLVYKEVGS